MSYVRKIKLKSSDGVAFEVDEAVAVQLNTIKLLMKDHCDENGVTMEIPVPKITSEILSKVIKYCEKHVPNGNANPEDRASSSNDNLNAWDAEFLRVDQATLFDLILAANFLNIKSMLDLTCGAVADMIKGKTPEEIIKFFNMHRDYMPEE